MNPPSTLLLLLLFLLLCHPSSAQLDKPLCSNHVHQKTYFLEGFDPLAVFGIAAPTWASIDIIFRKNESQALAMITTASPSDEISSKTEFRFSTDGPLQRFLEIYHVSSINTTRNDSLPSEVPTSPQSEEPTRGLESSFLPLSPPSPPPLLVAMATILALRFMTSFSDALVMGAGALVALGMARAQEELPENCTVSIRLEMTVPPRDYALIFQAVRDGSWVINNAASVSFLDPLDPANPNETSPTPFAPAPGALIGPKCQNSSGVCVDSSICSLIEGTTISSDNNNNPNNTSCPSFHPGTVCCTREDYVIDYPTIYGEGCTREPEGAEVGEESGCVLEEVCQIAGGRWQLSICQQFGYVCCFSNQIHVVRPG